MNEQQQRWNSAYTGRAPRTMQSAFNPYCDDKLEPLPDTDYSAGWWIAFGVVSILAVLAVIWSS